MPIVCPGCQQRVEPIRVFERSPKNGSEWTIVRCPRERCAFNIDLEPYVRPKTPKGGKGWGGGIWKNLPGE